MSSKEEKIGDFELAIKNLKEIVTEPETLAMRDATIKRFELCYDLAWKCLKHKLSEQGVEIQTPRSAYVEAVRVGLLKEENIWFEIIKMRNNAAHSYDTDLANELYIKIPEYVDEFDEVYEAVK